MRIQDAEDRRAARLLAALQIVHVLATFLGTVAASVFRVRWVNDSLLLGPLGLDLLVCTLLMLLSYVLVRAGRYRSGLALYISATALFPLLAPFVGAPPHEMGLVATAILPVLIAATFLSRGWVVAVAIATVGILVAELSLFPLPATEAMEGFAIALTVLASTGLMLVLRGHQRQIEVMRVSQLRDSEAALRASEERLRLLVGTSLDLIVVLDVDGKRKDAFGAIEAITGYALNERGPLSHFEAMHPEDRPRIQAEFAELLNPRETLEEIRGVTLRAATVTRQLLALSRKHVIEARLVDMNELYTENIIAHHGVLPDGIEFLSKPYTLDALAARMRGLLDRAEGAQSRLLHHNPVPQPADGEVSGHQGHHDQKRQIGEEHGREAGDGKRSG